MGKKKAKGKADDGPTRKVVLLATDMSAAQQAQVIAAASEGMTQHKIEKDIATFVKKKFDEGGGTWHCVVGKDFGCSICHECLSSMFFTIDGQYVLLFKSQE
jgi:dynein light chain LC8-type